MTGRTGPNKTSTGESPAAVLLPAPLYKTDPLLPCRRATSPATRHTERGPSSDLHGACHAPGRAEVVPGRGPGARLCKGGPRHGDWTRGDGSTRHACSVQGSRTREYTEEGGDVWRAPAGGGGEEGARVRVICLGRRIRIGEWPDFAGIAVLGEYGASDDGAITWLLLVGRAKWGRRIGNRGKREDVSETLPEVSTAATRGWVNGWWGLASSRAISSEHLTSFHPPSSWSPEAERRRRRPCSGWLEGAPRVSHHDGYGENKGAAVSDSAVNTPRRK